MVETPQAASLRRSNASRQAASPAAAGSAGGAAATPAASQSPVTFRDVLSALNPLQYLPVVGTIYRAVTGDQIPEAARRIGSLVVSALMGGPIGAMINIAATIAEKASGIDLDKTAQALLTSIGGGRTSASDQASAPPGAGAPPGASGAVANTVTSPAPASAAAGAATAAAGTAGTAPAPAAAASTAPAPTDSTSGPGWSPSQLAAYGVSAGQDGTLRLADVSGADVLNTIELSRIHAANAAYARAQDAGRPASAGGVA